MESHLRAKFVTQPFLSFIVPACGVAFVGLSWMPSAIPLITVLTGLQLFFQVILPRNRTIISPMSAWIALSLSVSLGRLPPSLEAPPTPSISFLTVFLSSCLSVFIAALSIFISVKVCSRMKSPWARLTTFPLIWTSVWYGVSCFNPFGRLLALSPVLGFDGYNWMTPYVGPLAKDWIVTAWSVLFTQMIGEWFIGEDPVDMPFTNDTSPRKRHLLIFGGILIALLLPSYYLHDLQAPIWSTHTTPIVVGCVLPHSSHDPKYLPTLEDYIQESKKLTEASVLLWPEGAITFDSSTERDSAFERVREKVVGPYVGVAFEDFVPPEDGKDVDNGHRLKRTGVALVSNRSNEVLLSYYKQALVPLPGSLISPLAQPPSLYTIDLTAPRWMKRPDWAPPPNYTRPIPVTTSINLDFAQAAPFHPLSSRPALILAPARTWHIDVGLAMWEQAKSRAQELRSTLLWCDGGKGGISGVAGPGLHEPTRVGMSSWTKTISVDWPFDEGRSVYALIGDVPIVILFVGVLGLGWVVEGGRKELVIDSVTNLVRHIAKVRFAFEAWVAQKRIAQVGPHAPLLG